MEKTQIRAMFIGAHPDDCDFKAAGTAIKLSSIGAEVMFVSATNGDTGHHAMGGGELARRRAEETKRSCEIAGIKHFVMDIHNNGIEANVATREKFIRLIREFNPTLIITHRPYDYHPDHRITSQLVQDSSYALIIPNVCPLIPAMKQVPVILYFQDAFKNPVSFNADIVVNIDDVMDKKIKMLDCHESQVYEWLPWTEGKLDTVPLNVEERLDWLSKRMYLRDGMIADRFRQELIDKYGIEKGNNVKCAEAFQICEYGAQIKKEKIDSIFPF